jgi:hypothetical protein
LPAIVIQPLDFDDTALWDLSLPFARPAARTLYPAVQAKVRMTGALISKLPIADHLRAKAYADII